MKGALRDLLPSSLLGRLLLLCLYIAPLAAIVWFVSQISVDVPFGDQLLWIDFFEKVHNGTAKFDDFFLQHNEHRMLVPRAVLVSLAFATGWNIRAELYLSIFLAAIAFLALFRISLKGFVSGAFQQPVIFHSAVFHAANLLTGCFIFSWIQHQNWLWGFQVPWFFINTCLAIAILALYPSAYLSNSSLSLSPWTRLGIAATFCSLASFSSAHGLFTWLSLGPSVVALGKTSRENVKHLSLWGLLFVACLAVYLIGYDRPLGADNYYARSVTNFLGFFLVSLGFPLLGNSPSLFRLMSLGALAFGTFLSIYLYGVAKLRTTLFLQLSPWLSLGTYACIFSLVNGYGRSGNGIGQALNSRYSTPGVLFCVALIQLLPIVCCHLGLRMTRRRLIAFGTVVVVFQARAFAVALEDASYGEDSLVTRLKQPACIEFIDYLEARGFNDCFRENENVTRGRIAQLNRIGLRESFEEISFVDISDADSLEKQTEEQTEKQAIAYPASYSLALNAMTSQVEIAGDIYLPSTVPLSQRPTAVVLAVDEQKTFVASTHLVLERVFERSPEPISKPISERSDAQDKLSWKMTFTNEEFIALASDAHHLSAYLYYSDKKQFVRLETETPLGELANWADGDSLSLLDSGEVFNDDERTLERRIGPNGQPVLLAHADTKVVVPLPLSNSHRQPDSRRQSDSRRQLSIGYGILDAAWQEADREKKSSADGVTFRVSAILADGQNNLLFSQHLDPHATEADRGEKQIEVALPNDAKQVVLETLKGPEESSSWDWSYWSKFELVDMPMTVLSTVLSTMPSTTSSATPLSIPSSAAL